MRIFDLAHLNLKIKIKIKYAKLHAYISASRFAH